MAYARPLDRQSLPQRSRPNRLDQRRLRHHVHRATKEPLEPRFESHEIQQGPTWFELHQEVHVALGVLFTAGNRAKHPQIGCTTRRCRGDNRVTHLRQLVSQAHDRKLGSALPCQKGRQPLAIGTIQRALIGIATARPTIASTDEELLYGARFVSILV